MVDFKVNISDPETGKTYPVEVSGKEAHHLMRRRIGDVIEGISIGVPGYKLQVTGGTDRNGFTLRPEVPGPNRRKVLVTKSVGFQPNHEGQRRRLTFRGNEIGPETRQINMRVSEAGPRGLDDIFSADDNDEE